MTTPFNPFLNYSNQLQTLIVKASKQKNPALWLYQNDARTLLFMLEALARLHDKAFGDKVFATWNKRFKKLEDELGALDSFTASENDFKNNKKIDKNTIAYFITKQHEVEDRLNIRLHSKKWFDGKLLTFNVKLSDYSVLNSNEYIEALHKTITKEILNISNFALKQNYSFTQLEEGVHEIRRKLRWISIYAQSLKGLAQLKPSAKKIKYTADYLNKAVLTSPYNVMPKKPNTTAIIEFDTNSFYALSYVIKELGTLKDNGHKVSALADAILKTEHCTSETAIKKAKTILGVKANYETEILKQASNLVFNFITKDKILDTLLVN